MKILERLNLRMGLFFVIFIGAFDLFLFFKISELSEPDYKIETTEYVQPLPLLSPTLTPDPEVYYAIVDYVPNINGKKALVIENTMHDPYYAFSSPAEKHALLDGGEEPYIHDIDEKLIVNPIRLFENTHEIAGEIISFRTNGENIYFSTYNGSGSTFPRTTSIYEMNLKTKELKRIWSNDLASEKYKDAHGAGFIEDVSGDYVLLKMFSCTQCEGAEVGKLIINTKTKKEKYLYLAGNLKMDITSQSFTYQIKYPTEVDCVKSYICPDGKMMDYLPSGEIITEPLP